MTRRREGNKTVVQRVAIIIEWITKLLSFLALPCLIIIFPYYLWIANYSGAFIVVIALVVFVYVNKNIK